MCDPITIASIALTAGSTAMNSMAAGRVNSARDDALTAERMRQSKLDREADALNTQSQDRYQDFEKQQGDKAQALGDYFAQPAADTVNDTAGAVMPSASNDVVNAEIGRQKAKSRAFTNQQATALGNMRSFGDLLGDTSRLQARDAGRIGQIGGFKAGSTNALNYELEDAAHKGDGLRTIGDIMGGLGSIGTMYGLTRGGGAALFGGLGGGSAPMTAVGRMAPVAKAGAVIKPGVASLYPSGLGSIY